MEIPRDSGGPGAAGALLTVCPLPDRPGVRAAGEITLSTRTTWEAALERLAGHGHEVFHVELSAVTFVDVAGASVLAVTAQNLGAGRRIVVDRPPVTLRRLLELFWPGLPALEVVT
ncbi:STAS domain-containing protein [Streptomyces rimosus]|uniref:STAS domain-containing protein n=1 Tax=Streptomyces rimosus TaxID=1927 RepID=UPI0004C25515|nr:STAS domain-containing protein [Streptomyces rimosus]